MSEATSDADSIDSLPLSLSSNVCLLSLIDSTACFTSGEQGQYYKIDAYGEAPFHVVIDKNKAQVLSKNPDNSIINENWQKKLV